MTQPPPRPEDRDPATPASPRPTPPPTDPLTANLIPPVDPWPAAAPPQEPYPPAAPLGGYPPASAQGGYPPVPPQVAHPQAAPGEAHPSAAYPAAYQAAHPAASQPAHPPPPYRYPAAFGGPAQVKSLRVPAVMATVGLILTILYIVILYTADPVSITLGDAPRLVLYVGIFATVIYTVVTFLVWLHRASANLWNTGHQLTWGPGWTIGAWCIPIANLIIPMMIIREVDRESRDHGPGLFAAYAVSWTVSVLLERSSRTASSGNTVHVVETVATIAAAITAILLIRRVTADQEQRFRTV